jgi:uncharacterized protein (DUF1697 family)
MKYYGFLKAVNVGGASTLAMAELKEILTGAGFGQVATYLRSGNMVLESGLGRKATGKKVESLLKSRFGATIPVFLKTGEELALILERRPFRADQGEKSKQLVYLLSRPASAEECAALGKDPRVVEDFHPAGDLLYVYYHQGVGRSRLTTNHIDRVLGLISTARNMNTIEALARM